jgi:hypothetical protein
MWFDSCGWKEVRSEIFAGSGAISAAYPREKIGNNFLSFYIWDAYDPAVAAAAPGVPALLCRRMPFCNIDC